MIEVDAENVGRALLANPQLTPVFTARSNNASCKS